jgi:hypothetical protein
MERGTLRLPPRPCSEENRDERGRAVEQRLPAHQVVAHLLHPEHLLTFSVPSLSVGRDHERIGLKTVGSGGRG